jgi:hypothetical protein
MESARMAYCIDIRQLPTLLAPEIISPMTAGEMIDRFLPLLKRLPIP